MPAFLLKNRCFNMVWVMQIIHLSEKSCGGGNCLHIESLHGEALNLESMAMGSTLTRLYSQFQ